MHDWVIPCNTKAYDVIGAFKEFKRIDWKQSRRADYTIQIEGEKRG